MFRQIPFVLGALIALLIVLDPYIPWGFKEGCYALSLSIKSLIVFFLPWIIFSLLYKASVHMASQATRLILWIVVGICGSNFLSTFCSHFVGEWVHTFNLKLSFPDSSQGLKPLWVWEAPKLIPNEIAMFSGLVLGILGGWTRFPWALRLSHLLEKISAQILNYFIYLIPLFIAGFIMKLQADGLMTLILQNYALVFTLIAGAQLVYILSAYFFLSKGNFKTLIESLKNMLPAAIAGFSTMSSAAAMPLTLVGTEKNLKNKDLADTVIPATVNVHLVGDCFAIPILAYAVLKSYGMPDPSLGTYLLFSFYFVIAKFSVAAIPGGGIVVMLPILEKYLGFNTEMLSLITALYILFDPVITCANVLGNGAFAQFMDRIGRYRREN